MEETLSVRQIYLQAGVLVAILLMIFGALFPSWFLSWVHETRVKKWLDWINDPFALFVIASLLFFYSFINLARMDGDPWLFATIKALVLYSVLFLITGLIDPEAVFARYSKRLGRFWVMVVGTLAFMATMTALGEYMKRTGRLEPPPLKTGDQRSGSNQENH